MSDDVAWEDRDEIERLSDEIEYLNREVQRLTNALQFYADADNWKSPSQGFALQYDRQPSPIEADRGATAQAALRGNE